MIKGRIMNSKTQRILTPVIDDKGYSRVTLTKDGRKYNVRVHRIIADTFLGEAKELDVRHKNLDRSKNCVGNLEHCTRAETVASAYDRGTKKAPRYTKIRVVETGDIFGSILECSKELGCDRTSISKCLSGRLDHVKGYHFEVV